MAPPFIDLRVAGPNGRQTVELLVDSGMLYSVLPHDFWRKLGLKAHRETVFRLLDDREFRRKVAFIRCSLGGRWRKIPVLLGEPGDAGIMGIVMLGVFGLIYSPMDRSLRELGPPTLEEPPMGKPKPRYARGHHGHHVH
jgi:hypothetical protein